VGAWFLVGCLGIVAVVAVIIGLSLSEKAREKFVVVANCFSE
jgi:hypothetical protein